MNTRTSKFATALALTLAVGLPAAADLHSWNVGNGVWSSSFNWTPTGQPFPLDMAAIGNLSGISNSTVTLNVGATVTSLSIENGMKLRTTNHALTVSGLTYLFGKNTVGSTEYPSTLRIEPGAPIPQFSTDDLTILGGSRMTLEGGVNVDVTGVATIGSAGEISGHGYVDFMAASGQALINNGVIRVTPGGMGLASIGAGKLDLDGANGDGVIVVDTQDNTGLTVLDAELYDSFSGTIQLTSNSNLTMWVNAGWTADASSTISVQGIIDVAPRPPAHIDGSAFTIAGNVNVGGFAGGLSCTAPTTFQPGAEVSIGSDDWAQFGDATINGGTFTVGDAGILQFTNANIYGGTFSTPSNISSEGTVRFFNDTTWDGTVTVNGHVSQQGDADVAGTTIINAGIIDMDGDSGANTWTIHSGLTINAAGVENAATNLFNGTLDILGGTPPKVTINTPGFWIMAGTLNLRGSIFNDTRIAGSPVELRGDVNVLIGSVRFTADTTFSGASGGSQTDLPVGTQLLLMGQNIVQANATFTGTGTIQNGSTGTMTLDDGATLGPIKLLNSGTLQVGTAAGAASVDRFQNNTNGTWRVSIAGITPGAQHDVLIVAGDATLAGNLQVDLLDWGGGLYSPNVGDEFTFLTAAGGVSGTFANSPVTVNATGTYQWTVMYYTNTVKLRLTGFTPADCYANCDLSTAAPALNINDFVCFLNKFAAGSAYANCDHSTAAPVLNVNDFVCFMNQFAAGCS